LKKETFTGCVSSQAYLQGKSVMSKTVAWWSRAVGVMNVEHSLDGLHGTGERLTEASVTRAAEAAQQRHEQRTTTSARDMMASPEGAPEPYVVDESRLGHALIVLQGNLLFWYACCVQNNSDS
jgi:hypothetical protein